MYGEGPLENLRRISASMWGLANELSELWNKRAPLPEAYVIALRHLSGEVDKAVAELKAEKK